MKRIVILGAAESGVGAAILAQKKGFEVFVSDMGQIKDSYKQMLSDACISWEEGGHTAEKILTATEVIKSPGIPEEAPMIVALRQQGTPVISDIEFAARYTKARMVCITGSNGKTTTTSLIYHILREAGYDVGLAGNIGRSFALQVAERERDWYVLELSSFQLDNMYEFRANVAVLLNITPDHLDRYGFEMQRYVDAKMRILQNMQSDDSFIYWDEDDYVPAEIAKRQPTCQLLPFSDEPQAGEAACGGETVNVSRPKAFSIAAKELPIPGKHNQRNVMAAALAALCCEVDRATLSAAIKSFPGVEHRLERVAEVNGVTYINDSKATNVDACYCAMQSVEAPVVLILGGKDKGNDYEQIRDIICEKCRALVFLGADNTKLKDFFADSPLPQRDTHTIEACVAACAELAQPGDTVLLSPCCASFDLFNGMAERGRKFKEQVKKLRVTSYK